VITTLTDPKHRKLDWNKIDAKESNQPVYTPISGDYLNHLLKEKLAMNKEKLMKAQELKKEKEREET